MASALIYTILSVIIVSLISLIGIFALFINKKYFKFCLTCLVAFSAGALIGDAFIHLIPEAVEKGFTFLVSSYILSGILFSFVIEKVFHWRHHHHLEQDDKHKKKNGAKILGYMNLVGDAVHNFIDGVVIGASYLVNFTLGFATTLAVVFHEIPQELGDFGVLVHSGFGKKKALLFNFFSATLAILGGIIAISLGQVETLMNFLIPFAAGNFIYIAASNLFPELQKEPKFKQSLLQFFSIVAGIAVMAALLLLEA